MAQRFFGRHRALFERVHGLAQGLVHRNQGFFKVGGRSTLQAHRTFDGVGAVFELLSRLVNALDRALQARHRALHRLHGLAQVTQQGFELLRAGLAHGAGAREGCIQLGDGGAGVLNGLRQSAHRIAKRSEAG